MGRFLKRNNIPVSDVRDNSAPAKAPERVVRKYDPGYIKFRFTKAGGDAERNACTACRMWLKRCLTAVSPHVFTAQFIFLLSLSFFSLLLMFQGRPLKRHICTSICSCIDRRKMDFNNQNSALSCKSLRKPCFKVPQVFTLASR